MSILLVESYVKIVSSDKEEVKADQYKPWLQGKLLNVSLLKAYSVGFSDNRYYEDTAFVEKCHQCITNGAGKYVGLPIVTVKVMCDNNKSVTRSSYKEGTKLKEFYWRYVGYTKHLIDVITWKHQHFTQPSDYELTCLVSGFKYLYGEFQEAKDDKSRLIILGCIYQLDKLWSELILSGLGKIPDNYKEMFNLLPLTLRQDMIEVGLGDDREENNNRDSSV